jgi:hypothetical protein
MTLLTVVLVLSMSAAAASARTHARGRAPGLATATTLSEAPAGLRAAVRARLTTPRSGPRQQAELTPTGGGRVLFGWFVAISGDTAVVGTPDCPGSACSGAAFVFVRSGQTWSQQAELTASDGSAHDDFGYNVAISGDTVVVGAAGKNAVTGAAYVFVRVGTIWTQQAELTASDGVSQDFFGGSAAVSGLTAAVGALGADSSAGAVYVFENTGGIWSQKAKLAASDGAAEHYFGSSVALSGTTMLVGASGANRGAGAAYVFAKKGGIWSQQGPNSWPLTAATVTSSAGPLPSPAPPRWSAHPSTDRPPAEEPRMSS